MLLFSFHRLSRWQKWHWDYEWLKTKLLCLFNWCDATFWNKAVVSLMSSKLHAKHYYDTRSKTISFTNWNIDKYVTFDDMIAMCVCVRATPVSRHVRYAYYAIFGPKQKHQDLRNWVDFWFLLQIPNAILNVLAWLPSFLSYSYLNVSEEEKSNQIYSI